jgi:hypothetical protein
MSAVGFRVRDGDDASCLNLNRVVAPRILGVTASALRGAFAFTAAAGGLAPASWDLLDAVLPDGGIPAIADDTVITWSLGKKLGDALVYVDEAGREVRLVLAAALESSVFQGSVLISDAAFRRAFPSVAGRRLFLVEAPREAAGPLAAALADRLVDSGVSVRRTGERLAELYSVENAYLSIFLALGGLGVLLGTLGLGAAVLRNLSESRGDLAILAAVGYPRRQVMVVVLSEHLLVATAGIGAGSAAALVAVWPTATAGGGASVSLLFAAVSAAALLAIGAAARLAARGDSLRALRDE